MTHSDVDSPREAYMFMYACLNIHVQSNTGVYRVLYTKIIWKILTVHVEI